MAHEISKYELTIETRGDESFIEAEEIPESIIKDWSVVNIECTLVERGEVKAVALYDFELNTLLACVLNQHSTAEKGSIAANLAKKLRNAGAS